MRKLAILGVACLGLLGLTMGPLIAGERDMSGDPDSNGIWKAFVPEGTKGELGSNDPLGLIAGKQIKADCSLNWRHQDGRLFCFSSGTSLVYFLQMPNTNMKRAEEAWKKLAPVQAGY